MILTLLFWLMQIKMKNEYDDEDTIIIEASIFDVLLKQMLILSFRQF